MTIIVAQVLRNFVPGSPGFLVAALVLGVAPLVFRRSLSLSRWQLPWLSGLVGAYMVLGLPGTARAVAQGLYQQSSVNRTEQALGASTIVVFDGDHAGLRVKEAVRLYALLHPHWVVVSSQEPWFGQRLARGGIPPERFVWDTRSSTTREQAVALAAILRARRIDRVVLIASPIHMPRALAACEAVGVRAVPSVTAPLHQDLPHGVWSAIPRRDALFFTNESLYEYLAYWWYRRLGWIA
jgi:uncharacterized SAM-binding protein YcdF (DUF218 family)